MNSSVADISTTEVADVLPPDFSLLGQSAAIRAVRAQIARLAESSVSVVIYGESGAGKELAARDIHALSARANAPFVPVNCGAIPENLMESSFLACVEGRLLVPLRIDQVFFRQLMVEPYFLMKLQSYQ